MTAGPPLTTARVQRVLPASPEVVYDTWLDEVALLQFICPAPGAAAEVSVDPRIGGRIRIVMGFSGDRREIIGKYVELDRPYCISFTWRSSDGVDSVVTVLLEPHGDGETLMTITHSRLPQVLADRFQDGWGIVKEQLAAHLARA